MEHQGLPSIIRGGIELQQNNTYNKKIPLNKQVLLFVIAVFLIAATLRSPLTGVGPIISFIQDDLSISNVLAGFLTTIPLLAFALVSPFAPKFARKFGMEWTIFYSMIFLCCGIVLRSLGSTAILLIGTMMIGVAIAFGNVLMPSLFKLRYPLHIGILTAIYSISMNISGGLSAGVSYPITETSFGWQGGLGATIIIGLLALIFWIPQLRGPKVALSGSTEARLGWGIFFRSKLAWAVMFAMGLQSFVFYSTAAWIPEIYISQGMEPNRAGWLISIAQISQIPMTFITPIIAARLSDQRPIVAVFTLFYFIGFTGMLFEWTEYAVIWMIFIGLAGGSSFSLAMMYFNLRTKTAYEAAELSGFAQSLGYLLAAIGPTIFGLLKDTTGSFFIPNMIFMFVAASLFTAGMIAGQNKHIR